MATSKKIRGQDVIPLFPLGVVLLPEMTLPLHIFEERYKAMITECLAQESHFGIVYYDGKEFRMAGCTAKILDVLKRYEDGRMDIVTEGQKRFFINEIDETRMYFRAGVHYFDDTYEKPQGEDPALIREALDLLKRLDRMFGTIRDYDALSHLDQKRLSFLIPGAEGFTPEERQQLLEMTSTRQRLLKCKNVLLKVIERTKISHEVLQIISGNGNVKKHMSTPPH
ncbi:MAG: LON peptidase substrate-binding domain-containing protein [Deltaproteobacteria bacterium]|nr:LON peptidase substrate-binding domain-containing protein [Deltaproteobacteria bacterium]